MSANVCACVRARVCVCVCWGGGRSVGEREGARGRKRMSKRVLLLLSGHVTAVVTSVVVFSC